MSFREEKKVLLHSSDYIKIRNLLDKYKGIKLYPKRIIKSLYFDNKQKDLYTDSEEGTLPRKKIRIRTYPNYSKKKYFFETKISSVEGRYKLTNRISEVKYNQLIKDGICDKQYGICNPLLWVIYEREYFFLLGKRITIDKNITYKSYKGLHKYFENEILILETKSKNLYDNQLFDYLPNLSEVRASKYCKAVDKIFTNHNNKLE